MNKTSEQEAKIFSTKEYNIFKILKTRNRKINNAHINKMSRIISEKNLLKDFPIVVSDDFTILDGQHRFFACQKLDIPIWYRVSSDMTVDDIPLVNSASKGWSLQDYLKKFLDENNDDYIKLAQCFEKNKPYVLSLSTLIGLLDNNKTHGANNTPLQKFKQGRFVYPVNEYNINETIRRLKSFSPYTCLTGTFIKACLTLFNIIKYDHKRMLDNLERGKYTIKSSPRIKEYFIQFNEIYNYGRAKGTVYLKPTSQKERMAA